MESTKKLLVSISRIKELVFVNIMTSTQNKTTLTILHETTTDQQEVSSSQEENKEMKQQENKKFNQRERYARKGACDPLWVKQRQEKLKNVQRGLMLDREPRRLWQKWAMQNTAQTPSQELKTEPADESRRISLTVELTSWSGLIPDGNGWEYV